MTSEYLRVCVAGSRTCQDARYIRQRLDRLFPHPQEIVVVSGGARGPDSIGAQWGRDRKAHRVDVFRAEWDRLGKRAGYIRNATMADNTDKLVAFWDGISRGTLHMIEECRKRGIPVDVIIPQFDLPDVPIGSFRGKYRWLSNFAQCVVRHGGAAYPTVEHAYQAAKFDWQHTPTLGLNGLADQARQKIQKARTPGDAKRFARQYAEHMCPNFQDRRLGVMRDLLRQKFRQEPYRSLLQATGRRDIVEGNTWGDTFWGKSGGTGQNNLGGLIMQIRDELELAELV